MKIITSIFIILLLCSLNSFPNDIKITQYSITADFTKDSNSADITAECIFKKDSALTEFILLLNHGVKIKSIDGNYITPFAPWMVKIDHKFKGKDSLLIELPQNFKNHADVYIKFQYSFPVNIYTDSINVLDRGHRWYPIIPDNIAPFKLICTIPKGFTSFCVFNLHENIINGTGYEHTWQCTYPVFKIPLIIYREYIYSFYDSDFSGKFFGLHYFKNDSLKADTIIQKAKGILNFCNNYIGAFGYHEIKYIEIPGLEGMNIGSGIIMAGANDLKYISNGYYDALYLTCIQQWFGARVFAKYGSPGFWLLSLSLPHYIRMLYIKESQGEEAFNKELTGRMEKYELFAGTEKDVPITDIDYINTQEKGQVLYIKGPYIFYKLHMLMGDEPWHKFIRELYVEYAGKVMSLDDLKSTLKKYDPDDKILEIFNNMITKTGMV